MQNMFINRPLCEKFYCDRLRNDRALRKGKSDNRTPRTRTTFVAIGDPFPGPKIKQLRLIQESTAILRQRKSSNQQLDVCSRRGTGLSLRMRVERTSDCVHCACRQTRGHIAWLLFSWELSR